MQLPLFHTGNHARHQQRSTQYSPGRRFQRFLMGRSINKYDRIKSDRPKTSRTGIQSSPGSSIVDSESLSSHGHSRSSVPSRSHLSRSTSHSINHHLPPQISDRPAQQVSIPAQAHLVEHSPHADVADEEQGRRERGTHQLRRRKRRRSPIFSNKSWLLGRNPTTMKSKIISCILSGIFLTIMLSTYIALTQSKPKILQSLHALFLLIIVTTTIFFCHCLVRLCMLALDKKASSSSSSGRRRRGTQTHHHDGHHPREGSASAEEGCIYPARPIPVITDVAVTDPETAKRPPPAYGHWRGSVRADPGLLHWQRVERPPLPPPPSRRPHLRPRALTLPLSNLTSFRSSAAAPPPTVVDRPPSYMSDEGVEYVLSPAANMRSMNIRHQHEQEQEREQR